jgi:hypothetical protein
MSSAGALQLPQGVVPVGLTVGVSDEDLSALHRPRLPSGTDPARERVSGNDAGESAGAPGHAEAWVLTLQRYLGLNGTCAARTGVATNTDTAGI